MAKAPPDVTNKEVFIIDFSYKKSILLEMREKAKSITLLDHHKTAQESLKDLPFCIFNMNRSGAGLTWEYFNHFTYPRTNSFFDAPMPPLIQYVQDRDLGINELPNTEAINAFIMSYPMTFDKWDELATISIGSMVEKGVNIVRYKEQVAEDLCRYAREVSFDGQSVLSVNTSILNTDVGCKIAKNRPFGIVWFQRNDGKYVYSLRSTKESGVDVGQIALKYGGGGHFSSSGFVADEQLI